MSDAATDTIRIGLIGVGGMCRAHIAQLTQMNGVEIVALCDTAPSAIAKAVEKFPQLADVPVYSDYKELLGLSDVDAVQIATPHTQHAEQALDAINANKHVLLEKPMVCEVGDAHKLLARLENHDKVFALAYQRHAQGAFKYMKERIGSGELGAVTFIAALQCQQWLKGTAGSWRQILADSGGGQINDSGSHLLDIILWMTGLTVADVSAFMDNMGTPVAINSAVKMRFTNGAQGTISIVGDATIWHEDITIWCEKGVFLYRNGSLEFAGTDGKKQKIEDDLLPSTEGIDQDFVRAIKGEKDPAAPPICGLRTIELTEAAWKSAAQQGQPVKMN